MANPTLLWFAGYSNMSSVAVVAVCFIIMTVFIGMVRMNLDFITQVPRATVVKEKSMVKVVNPFVLKLADQDKNLKDGARVCLSTLCPCRGKVYWGVKINALHDLIAKTGYEIRQLLLSDEANQHSQLETLHSANFQFSAPGHHELKVSCPDVVTSSSLGDMPRKRYPLVIFTFVSSESTVEGQECNESNNIMGSIAIIHLKDEVVGQMSHIIEHYIKTNGFPVYSLKPLYITSGENSPSDSVSESEQAESSSPPDRQNVSRDLRSVPEGQNEFKSIAEKSAAMYPRQSSGVARQPVPGEGSTAANGSSESDSLESLVSPCTESTPMVRTLASPVTDSALLSEACRAADSHPQQSVRRRIQSSSTQQCEAAQTVKRDSENIEEQQKLPRDVGQGSDVPMFIECVVCQSRRAKCALLPCRHACVCYSCLRLLDRCPMCRSNLESYFFLTGYDGEEESEEEEDMEDNAVHEIERQAINASFTEMWERFNIRLNELLGFQ